MTVLAFLVFILIAVEPARAFGQGVQSGSGRPDAITVRLGLEDAITFRGSQGTTTDIDLHVRGADYTVPLQCAGGLRDVHVETAELIAEEEERAEGTFALLFDMGIEQDRRFGKFPRVQLSFYRRRLVDMLVTTQTSERSAHSSNLCSTLPVGPVTCKDTRQLQGLPPEDLVEQLRDLPAPMPATAQAHLRGPETRRRSIYEELLDWGPTSIPPLVAGLNDPDVRLRRNAVLALMALSGGWLFECGPAKVDISSALPALVIAFKDPDAHVRAWAAQTAGALGASAASAVPALIELLEGDEGSRTSACLVLGQIGPAARAALPALQAALADPSEDVRRFAADAILQIEEK